MCIQAQQRLGGHMRQKSKGTHLILMELMFVLFFFAICGVVLIQVFVKSHNTSVKAKELTETKNYVTQAAELIEAGSYEQKEFQEYFPQIKGKDGSYQCYFDKNWKQISGEKAVYQMKIKLLKEGSYTSGEIRMLKKQKQIYYLKIKKHEQARKGKS